MKNHFKLLIISLLLLSFNNCIAQINWDNAETIIRNLNPVLFPKKTYQITDFGAVANNQTPCKKAFDTAISQCSENGGGTIIVSKGDYYMDGPLVLKSNVCIQLEEDATLNFSSNEKDYLPAVLTRWEGTELYNYSPLIYAYQAHNIALIGKGTVNGNGSKNFSKWKKTQNNDKITLRKMGTDVTPVYERVFGEGHFLRPSFIQPFGCTNVRIEDITIKDAPFWVIHPVYCDNVIVRGVNVESRNTNNDGCDPDSTSNILIENSTFSTGDDGIAIKSGRDNDAWRVGRPTENVVIRNCDFESEINGICIGSEISGGVRNVFIENCKIPKSANAIYFKSNTDRGAFIENIFVRNIQSGTASSALIRFEPDYKGEGSKLYPTKFTNFHIENISGTSVEGCALYLSGFKSNPLTKVSLSNISIEKAITDYCLKNGTDIVFDAVKVNGILLDKKPKEKSLVKLKTF